MDYNDRNHMGKKDFVPVSSVSILLVIPEGIVHQQAAKDFLASHQPEAQVLSFNPTEETVKIDMVRELLRHSSFARSVGEPQALVLEAVHTATIPAQNALLKLVEEPPAHTSLILTARSGHQLLPTLLSRCREILWAGETAPPALDHSDNNQTELVHTVREFLAQPAKFSYADLILLSEQLKDTTAAQSVLRQTLSELANAGFAGHSSRVLQHLLSALTALEKNGNVRLVLEHCFFQIKKAGTGASFSA